MAEEQHDVTPLHYGCDIGGVHFAIHPAEGWPGRPSTDALSPVVALSTTDLDGLEARVKRDGVSHTGPLDHGWALVITFRDPDGNRLEILKLA